MNRQPVILSACRTPIGSFGGALKDHSAVDLGAIVIRDAIARAGIERGTISDVVLGCVLQGGAGMNVARQAAIKAGLAVETPAVTINRVCGSGLQAIIYAAQSVQAGGAGTIVAGGTESMSTAPYILRSARWGYRMGHGECVDSMISDGLYCAIDSHHMGMTAEAVAERWGVSRPDQDAFALESQQRAAQATKHGAFHSEMVPVSIAQKRGAPLRFEHDEHIRPDTSMERLASLKAAFSKDGSVTAGNSSGINDGAAALVIASQETATSLGVTPIARILGHAVTGIEPRYMGVGPVEAIRSAVARSQLSLTEIDLFELNEAFAAQAIVVMRELQLAPTRVNVSGGAIALGHPIGASGARILTTLIHALRGRQQRLGVAALCIGGGMGIAMVVEAL